MIAIAIGMSIIYPAMLIMVNLPITDYFYRSNRRHVLRADGLRAQRSAVRHIQNHNQYPFRITR